MNAERLHAIARAITEDIEASELLPTLQTLNSALSNLAQQPGDANAQQQAADSRTRLGTLLTASAVNDFSPLWQQTVEELGFADLLGTRLLARIEDLFVQHQVTPAVIQERVNEWLAALTTLKSQLDALLATLQQLNIGDETLEPGQVEVGVIIPRGAVNSQLTGFGKELQLIEKLFGPFLELATGSRPPLELVTISSSDFGVFCLMVPSAAGLISWGVDKILGTYKTILEIRLLRQQLNEHGLADEELASVDSHANDRMEKANEDLSVEIVASTTVIKEEGRRNELTTAVRLSLNGIANRIDAGYNFEVRAALPEGADDGDEESDGDESADAAVIRGIIKRAPNLTFINTSGKPILSLEEAPDDDA